MCLNLEKEEGSDAGSEEEEEDFLFLFLFLPTVGSVCLYRDWAVTVTVTVAGRRSSVSVSVSVPRRELVSSRLLVVKYCVWHR